MTQLQPSKWIWMHDSFCCFCSFWVTFALKIVLDGDSSFSYIFQHQGIIFCVRILLTNPWVLVIIPLIWKYILKFWYNRIRQSPSFFSSWYAGKTWDQYGLRGYKLTCKLIFVPVPSVWFPSCSNTSMPLIVSRRSCWYGSSVFPKDWQWLSGLVSWTLAGLHPPIWCMVRTSLVSATGWGTPKEDDNLWERSGFYVSIATCYVGSNNL